MMSPSPWYTPRQAEIWPSRRRTRCPRTPDDATGLSRSGNDTSSHLTAKTTGEIPPLLLNSKGVLIEDGKVPFALSRSLLSSDDILDWFNKSPELDQIEGCSVDRVYDEFPIYNDFRPVIVAVIDSGIDIHHEELKGKIWTNPYEIPNNGIDDDRNGYVDDINGWNFAGGKDGRNVEFDTLEVTREFKIYSDRIAAGEKLTPEEMAYFEGVKKDFEDGLGYATNIFNFATFYKSESNKYKQFLSDELGLTDFSKESLENIQSSAPEVIKARDFLLETLSIFRTYERIDLYINYYNNQILYHYNPDYDSRSDIVKDDPDNLYEIGYGNNDPSAHFSNHGTHVSGIIAADRFNNLGIKGVASNVKIMALRAVANGDERDKDVANAVRYAVKNGAKIINMSFGKTYSPHKEVVDKAFRYASRRGVLIVHSAGNDGTNNDEIEHFPNRFLKRKPWKAIKTWVDVGASSYYNGEEMVASFSCFGKKSVDVFAPGHQILSSIKGNQYASYSGTSMAAPAFSGVAALVLSQDPGLRGKKLKKLLLKTARTYPGLQVKSPENPDVLVPFEDLSITGGIVDAYNAFLKLYDDEWDD